MPLRIQEARAFGTQIADCVKSEQFTLAQEILDPILEERTPFRILGAIGKPLGSTPAERLQVFLEQVSAAQTEGGWVIIGSALQSCLESNPQWALDRCQAYVQKGDAWYVPDILGERVPGPALVLYFDQTLKWISDWRSHPDYRVRKMVGVGVHFWAKRVRGAPPNQPKVLQLLAFLQPMLEEKNLTTIKGLGWGLKTLGKYYPQTLAAWLAEMSCQVSMPALMLRKAQFYLPHD